MIWFVIWFALAVYSVAGLAVLIWHGCRWPASPRKRKFLPTRGAASGRKPGRARFRVAATPLLDTGRHCNAGCGRCPAPNQPSTSSWERGRTQQFGCPWPRRRSGVGAIDDGSRQRVRLPRLPAGKLRGARSPIPSDTERPPDDRHASDGQRQPHVALHLRRTRERLNDPCRCVGDKRGQAPARQR